MSAPKSKTIHYRRCVPMINGQVDSDPFDLQSLLEQALTTVSPPRIRAVGIDGSTNHHLAHVVKKGVCLCGQIVKFVAGRKVPLIGTEPTTGETYQGKVDPIDSNGKLRNLEEQSLCFAIRSNHVAVIQTRELSIDDLRVFLAWIIQERAHLVPQTLFSLENVPSTDALAKLEDGEIRGITVGGMAVKAEKEPFKDDGSKGGRKRRWITKIKQDSRLLDLLKPVLDAPLLEALEKHADPGNLEVQLDISYRSRNPKDGQRILRSVAAGFGGQEGIKTEIRLKGKTVISGEEMTICEIADVQCPDGTISPDDAMTVLSNWLMTAIQNRKLPL